MEGTLSAVIKVLLYTMSLLLMAQKTILKRKTMIGLALLFTERLLKCVYYVYDYTNQCICCVTFFSANKKSNFWTLLLSFTLSLYLSL